MVLIDYVIYFGVIIVASFLGNLWANYLSRKREEKLEKQSWLEKSEAFKKILSESPIIEEIVKKPILPANKKKKSRDGALSDHVIKVFKSEKKRKLRAKDVMDSEFLPNLGASSYIKGLKIISHTIWRLEKKGILVKYEKGLYGLNREYNKKGNKA